MPLAFASLFTLGIMFGMVGTVILAAAYFADMLELPLVIGLTVLLNLIGWLIGPAIMDFMQHWFYKIKVISLAELKGRSQPAADLIERICREHKFKVPKLKLIEDDNPTAFCFGSGRYNARLVISEGLFTYLNDAEIEAVIAHEMGHIVRRDFIVMTIASTLVQILYELGELLVKKASNRGSSSKKGNPLIIVGIFSYIFYFIATYLLLFLSRTREYGADAFAANQLKDPNMLSSALIKIAYGIVAKPEDAAGQRLLNSTRSLGIFDNKAAKNLGHLAGPTGDKTTLGKVLLFDFVSPWAKILELASTHPLTGKRIRRLAELGSAKGQKPLFDFENLKNSISIDHGKLWRGFWIGALFYYAPALLILIGLIMSYFNSNSAIFIPALFGIGILLRALYRYPSGEAAPSTVLAAMTDIYASPVRGKKIALAGQIIGRGQAGAYLSEDLMLQDATGLVYLNYESAIPLLGNLFAALGKIKKLIGEKVSSTGWFFRGLYHHIDLERVTPEKSKAFNSHPILGQVVLAVGAIALSLYFFNLGVI